MIIIYLRKMINFKMIKFKKKKINFSFYMRYILFRFESKTNFFYIGSSYNTIIMNIQIIISYICKSTVGPF